MLWNQADGFLETRQLCTGSRKLDRLLGTFERCGRISTRYMVMINTSPKYYCSPDSYHDICDKKVADIMASSAAPTYVSNDAPPLQQSDLVSVDDVIKAILSSPSKQGCIGPLPIWLLKKTAPTLAPFITSIINESLSSERFPSRWKHAVIKSHLKKAGLDEAEPSN